MHNSFKKILRALAVIAVLIAAAGAYFLISGSDISGFNRLIETPTKIMGQLPVTNLRQLITQNNSTGRTILWELTSPSDEEITVEVRNVGGENQTPLQFAAHEDFFTDDNLTIYQYAATLSELIPATHYEYRLTTPSLATDWSPLYTPSENESFRMMVYPDSQSADYTGWQQLAKDSWQRNPDTQLFINMGDLVDNGEAHGHWTGWFAGVEDMQQSIPFAPVMGNHETYDLSWELRLPKAYLSYFPVPTNDNKNFDRYYYSFDYGSVHFIVLNTQDHELKEFLTGINEEQVTWIERDMARSQKPWNIVLMHRDVLQYRINDRPERAEGFSDEGTLWMPIFERLGIDLVFSAHLHTYRNRGHLEDFDSSANPRAPLYILTGVAGDVRYANLWVDHALDKTIAPKPETANYLTVDVSPTELTVCAFLPDGKEFDRVTVSK